MRAPEDAPLNVLELEALAAERLSQIAYDYYRSGAHDERTLERNRAAFAEHTLHYRVLVDVSNRNLQTEVLGRSIAMPILVAPTAFHGLAHPEGERATARAAHAMGVPMVLSTLANTTLESVAEAAQGPLWFQLYIYKDRGATEALVKRAEAAGYEALVLTVDAPLLGTRERDKRNRFTLPDGLTVANMDLSGMKDLPKDAADSGLAAYVATQLNPALTYDDLAWLRSITTLPIVVKGVVRPDDAVRCKENGAAGIIVSNHGGRQLDTAPATIDVIADVADALDAAGGDITLLMDGGVRRGTDIVKALALGAHAVLVGRPVLWGLAWDGQRGVETALDMLKDELDLAMALCGCPSIDAIDRDLVQSPKRRQG